MTVARPIITSSISASPQPQGIDEISILYVGQKTSAGTATAGAITENIISIADLNTRAGRTSHLAKVIRPAFQNIFSLAGTKRPIVDFIALDDDGSAVDADGTIAFSGTATEAGSYTINVDGDIYTLPVASGDTATEVGDALEALITANANANYTASNSTGTVTITAVNGGTVGNDILTVGTGTVAGLTLTVGQVYLTSGATDPSLTNLFDVITNAQKKYTFIVYPSQYTRSTLTDFTEAQFATNDRMFGVQCVADTYANLNTLVDGLNLKTLSIIGNVLNASGKPQIQRNVDVITSTVIAEIGCLLTTGSNVSSFVVNSKTRGGAFWASIPFHNLVLKGLGTIDTDAKISQAQSIELTNSGLVVLQNNKSNTELVLSTVKTTYKTDALGNNDPTFQELNRYLQSVLSVEYIINNLAVRCAQVALTDAVGTLPSNQAILNGEAIINILGGYYDVLSDPNGDYQLLRSGKNAEGISYRDAFKEVLQDSITITLSSGTVAFSQIELPLIAQLRELDLSFFINVN
jgi:phage tail sheath gpL-like